MGKYLITGRQGSGKTTVIKELLRRGFTAYNTDDLPGATKLLDRETGEAIPWPKGVVDWTKYKWNWQEQPIKQLLASDDTVFLGGVVSNQKDFYAFFDKIFVLTVDAATLRRQLETHEHASHHLPGEIERLTADHDIKQNLFIKEGDMPIQGMRPVKEIVDDILAALD